LEEFRTARLRLSPFIRWCDARHPGRPPDFALLREFAREDTSHYVPAAYRVTDDA
jgi:hypothetical protein